MSKKEEGLVRWFLRWAEIAYDVLLSTDLIMDVAFYKGYGTSVGGRHFHDGEWEARAWKLQIRDDYVGQPSCNRIQALLGALYEAVEAGTPWWWEDDDD